MRLWDRFVGVIGGRNIIMALGVLYLVLVAGWVFMPTPPEMAPSNTLIVVSFIGGSGALLLGGGYRLPRTDILPRFYSTIAVWCLVGIGVMLAILALYNFQPGPGLSNLIRSVLILTGFSSVAGYGVGTYAAHAKTGNYQLERQNRLLEQTQRQLEESNQRLEQFAYAASHDLQEPLRMVSSYLELIERRYGDELDEDGEEFLDYAIDGSERMKEMIEGLLEYSRVDTQGEPFEPVDLDEVLANVRKDLELQIEETQTTIETDELPRVEGDESQLRQLFQNLLSNAIEYTGDEAPRIDVSAERDTEEWIISVRDNGIGIDPEDQDRVFEVFQRLHSQEEHSGTGIGLALCKRIVERHGGEIRIDSAPGEGTTFTFSLPAVPDKADTHPTQSDSIST
ncbi:ATP-binding protein [Natrinema zhouii]|uniref:histidine kinase n=1 Tax=Natrinema zhouii TaxID=1710539 RepID=A0A7D6GX16_9EURY|nr:ATP-binding protein [Natrinema zhouii]QLK26866.1 ATP-binding protein [Natrinema zhouii]